MCSELWFQILERERERLISRFLDVRIVSSRRSKKQSCSTQQRLRVGTDFVEFRQLQDVGIFSYLVYSLAKSHFMDGDLLRSGRPCYRSQNL